MRWDVWRGGEGNRCEINCRRLLAEDRLGSTAWALREVAVAFSSGSKAREGLLGPRIYCCAIDLAEKRVLGTGDNMDLNNDFQSCELGYLLKQASATNVFGKWPGG
jgi:hypothetical protein